MLLNLIVVIPSSLADANMTLFEPEVLGNLVDGQSVVRFFFDTRK